MTDENFEEVIETYDHVFVLFYVPFCSHSDKLSTTFTKTYNKYYKKKKKIRFGKLNAYLHKKYSKKLQLRGWPAMLLFQNSIRSRIVYESEVALYDLRSFIDA